MQILDQDFFLFWNKVSRRLCERKVTSVIKYNQDNKLQVLIKILRWFLPTILSVGRGCGQLVSVLTFYSDDPSSHPVDAYSFFSVNFVIEKNENKQKRGRGWPIKKQF